MTSRARRITVAVLYIAPLVVGASYLVRYPHSLFLGDGYIFLQYAKNIASGGGWSLNAGETSFATTSPAWTILLAGAAFITSSHLRLLASLLGLAVFWLGLVLFHRALERSTGGGWLPLVGFAAVALNPFSGIFYALSAMETGLYLLVFMACLVAVQREDWPGASSRAVGILSGLAALTRPEGLLCAIAYVATCWPLPARKLTGIASRTMGLALALLAPWELFLIWHTGSVLPTSGDGRLYGYLSAVFPHMSVATYRHLSLAERIALIPTVFRTQFFAHAVMLVFCLLPYIVALALFAWDAMRRHRTRLGTYLVVYCTLNLFAYLLFQPLIVQRYLVTFLPAAVLMVLIRPCRLTARPIAAVATAVIVALIVLNLRAVPYYDDHVRLDAETVRLMDAVPASGRPCRLAAEPLGYAGYFTHCYVIDLGGLIDPALWQYWMRGETALAYALDQGADYLVGPVGLPSDRFTLLHEERARALYRIRRRQLRSP